MRAPAAGRAGAAAVALAALLAAACGIPSDEGATLARADDVPFDLLAEVPETTATTAPSAPGGAERVTATIFLIQGERLAVAEREVEAPATADVVLDALVRGPTRAEGALGLRSALVGNDVIRSVGVQGGIATVDLGPGFTEIVGRDQIMALAQIVSTVTSRPGVGRVSFTLEGVPVGVPRGDGAVTTESVSIDDYALLAPVPQG